MGWIRETRRAETVAELKPPFNKSKADGFDYAVAAPALEGLADSNDDVRQSPFVVYENDRALGPAHSEAADIHELGHGRFLHWKGIGFIISSSDGTDPAKNGRNYWVELPNPPPDSMDQIMPQFSLSLNKGSYSTVAAPA